MKCTAIKLSIREQQHRNQNKLWNENNTPRFIGEETHSYSFPYIRRKSNKPKKTNLTITNIMVPENFPSFNTGSSLEKWSKKRPRLKSAKGSKNVSEDDRDFCYETLETELSLILHDVDELSQDDSLNNLEYEVHTDIEKLLLKSQRNKDDRDEIKGKLKRRRKKRTTKGKQQSDKSKEKNEPKTIKFSISKPPSPQTEQVIRVDVTSNVSAVEDLLDTEESNVTTDNCNKSHVEMIDDKRKELKRNLNESSTEMCDEDFIVRCRQLALRQRRRRL